MVETELVVKIASGGAGQTVRDVVKVQEALAQLGRNAKDTAQLAKALGKAFDLDPSEVEELAEAMGQARVETGKLGDEAERTAKKVGTLDEVFAGFLRSLGEKGLDLGVQAFQALGAAIQDTVARANQEFGAFDQALTKFSAKSGIARDGLQELEEESIRLALITSQTPASVAELAEQLLALGATSEQVQERLNGITILADLVGESAVTTGKVVQTALNIFGEFGETSDGVADKINKFINTTAAGSSQGIEEFLQLFQTTGSAAKGLGVQFDELGTAFAVLRDNGFSAEVAATGLKTAMLKIGAPTGAAAAELEKLGVKAFDAEGKFVGLESVFQQLKETTQNLTQEELIEAVNNIGGAEGVPALLALIDQVDGRWQEVAGNVAEAQGSAAESLEVLNTSVERQAELLSGTVSLAYTQLGEAIAPIRQSVLEFANSLISTTGEGTDGLGQLQEAADRFSAVLSGNPEILERIAEALAELANVGVQQVSLLVDAITAFVAEKDNIDAIGESIESLAIVLVRLGQTARFIVALTEGIIGLKTRIDELPPAAEGFKASLDVLGLTKGFQIFGGVVELLNQAFLVLNTTVDSTKNFIQNLVDRFDFLSNNPVIKALLGQILQADEAAVGFGASLAQTATTGAEAVTTLGTATKEMVKDVSETEGLGEGLADPFEDELKDAVSALDGLAAANRDALDDITTDTDNAKADLLENGGTQAEVAALEKKALEDRIAQNKTYLQQLKDAQASGGLSEEEALQVADTIRQVEGKLASDRVSLAQTVVNAQRDAAKAAEDAAKESAKAQQEAVEAAAKAQADALKETRDEAKRLAEESFGDTQREEGVIFSEAQAAKAEAFQTAQQADQEAFNKAQQTDQEAFNDQQQSKAKAFQSTQQADQESFADSQAAAAKAFQKGQQAEAENFQKAQQASAQEFQKQLDAERDQGGREFNVLTSEVERRVQLEQAASDQQRRELEEQFKLEDEQLKKRRDIEAEVLRERGSVLADRQEETQLGPLEQARADFEQQLQDKAEGFQALQQEAAAAFQAEQDAKAEAFAAQQEEADRAFKAEQDAAAEAFAAEQKEADKAFQAEQDAAAKAFQEAQQTAARAFSDEQKALDRAFQAEQQADERAFKEQQRQLDKANAEAIARILEAAKPRGIDGARRDGGPVRAGGAYLVGEDGPELVTPRRGGYVYTAQQTAALMAGLPTMRGVSVPALGSTARLEGLMGDLLQEVRKGRQVRPQSTYNLTTASPVQDAMALQLAEIRALMDRRGL
jgi:TP901 family phage tail tape measure protein